MKTVTLTIIFLLSFSLSRAQNDSIAYGIKILGNISSEGYSPHYIESNRFGIYNDTINDLLIMPGIRYPIRIGEHFKINTGLDLAGKRNFDESFVYQGYVNISYGPLELKMGRQEYTLGQVSETLSSGSFLVSNNAKPIPRIGIGFYDYTNVPFTHGYLQVKGGLNHGWLDNDRLDHSPYNKPLLHEKFAYIRTRKIPVNPYVGVAHYAMYGGERQNGNEVGIDYKAVFFGQGSSEVGNLGEEVNAAGEHLGIVDLGADIKISDYQITYYYHIPINDRTGLEKNFGRNKDFFTGLVLTTEKKNLLNGFSYEFIHTTQQTGLGIPDPIVDGRFVTLWNENDREYLKDHYTSIGVPVDDINTELEWRSFLQAYINHGYLFGGRSDFYNNFLYTHVYNGRIIGTPLFQTKPELEKMTGDRIPGDYIVNNRIIAHHLGLSGYVNQNLDYRFMLTFTRNKGAWQEYGGRTKWEGIALDPDFDWYWRGNKDQWYSLLETTYRLPSYPGLGVKAGIALDFGDLDDNFGAVIGVTYDSFFKF